MEKEIMKEEEVKQIIDNIKEKIDIDNLEEMLKNNYIEFKHLDVNYRVRLLNREDKDELHLLLVKKLNVLLQDEEIKKESELKEIYKEKRNIDIDEIDKQINKLKNERLSIQLKLGEAMSKKVEEGALKEYKNQIDELNEAISKIGIKKDNLLSHSMEKLLESYELEVKTWLALEKKLDEEWIRAFNTFDSFRKCEDENLIIKAGYYNLYVQLK